MTTTKRQTAGNNATLARVKATMNAPIFKRFADLYNGEGPGAAREYLGHCFGEEYRERRLAVLFDGASE